MESNPGPLLPLPLLRLSDDLSNLAPLPPLQVVLSVTNHHEAILSLLDDHHVIIICGKTGCSKSTQVPQYLFEGMDAMGH